MNWGAWYGEEAVPVAASDDTTTTVQELIPIATSFIKEMQDPYRRVEIAKARLDNARARGAAPSRLRILEARYRAARTQVGLETEEVTSVRRFRGLGQAALVSAIVVAGALTILLLTKATRS